MIVPVIITFILLECLNRIRHRKIKNILIRLYRIDNDKFGKASMFTEMYESQMTQYARFMRKQILNDNFFDIFSAYYPGVTMTRARIKNVIRKYIFDLDPVISRYDCSETNNNESSHTVSNLKNHKNHFRYTDTKKVKRLSCQLERYVPISRDVPITAVEVHKTINGLTKRFESMYLVDDFEDQQNDVVKMNSVSDLTNIIEYKSTYRYILEFLQYMKFCIFMRRNGYRAKDFNHDIRGWQKIGDNLSKILHVVILDDDAKKSMMANNHDYSKESSIMYIEIKGFSNYSAFFDLITCDVLNRYSDIDSIIKQFSSVLKLFPDSKINIFASRESTILIPFLLNCYHEKLDKIVAVNPIFYSYAFHTFFNSVNNKKLDVYMKPNLIRIFNGLTLLGVYFDKNTDDKKINRLYSRNINIDFDKDGSLYTNCENLSVVLDMYSHVRVDDSRVDKSTADKSTKIETDLTLDNKLSRCSDSNHDLESEQRSISDSDSRSYGSDTLNTK